MPSVPATPATRSSTGCAVSRTRGCTSAATRCSASWPASSAASTRPSATFARAAATSGRLGFRQTEAYQITSLARAQCQAGDYEAGAATLALGIAKAEATGDMRLAALGRVHLGRVLRALGRDAEARTALEQAGAFHRGAGGGEQAALGDCLLAALDAADDVPDAGRRLDALLEAARRGDDAPVEVFALDALGRLTGDPSLHEMADRRMEAASHFITARDRTDRRAGASRRTPSALR